MEGNIIYANSLGIAFSPVDCCITLMTSYPRKKEPDENVYHVFLSIQYAKILAESLQEQLQIYQDKYGPINNASVESIHTEELAVQENPSLAKKQ